MRSKHALCALCSALVLVTFTGIHTNFTFHWFSGYISFSNRPSSESRESKTGDRVDGFDGGALSVVNTSAIALRPEDRTSCVTRSVAGYAFPICLYSASEDIYISAQVENNNGYYYDSGMVGNIMSMLRKLNTDAAASSDEEAVTFIDIGANIGSYSLAAAHQANQVRWWLLLYGC